MQLHLPALFKLHDALIEILYFFTKKHIEKKAAYSDASADKQLLLNNHIF